MRRFVWFGAFLALVAAVALGLSSVHRYPPSRPSTLTLSQEQRALRGSTPALARLHVDNDRLLVRSRSGVGAKLAALRGTPYVVVKWASWCAPCLEEWPHLQRVATQVGRRVAFVGLDVDDVDSDARALLKRLPMPFPSYSDPDIHIAYGLGIPTGQPILTFYDAHGAFRFRHEGPFESDAELRAAVAQIE